MVLKRGSLQNDSTLMYFDSDRRMDISGSRGKYSLRLTEKGVVYTDADTTFLFQPSQSSRIPQNDSSGYDILSIEVNGNDFFCEFRGNRISSLYVDQNGYNIKFVVLLTTNSWSWDFGIRQDNKKDFCSFSYSSLYPYLVTITDYQSLLGGFINFSRRNGSILNLEVMKINKEGSFIDRKFKTQYFSRYGILRKGKKLFTTSICE